MEEIKLCGLAAPTDWLNSQTGLKLNGKQTNNQRFAKVEEKAWTEKKEKENLVNISSVISIKRENVFQEAPMSEEPWKD